ncbi:PAS domain-containing protein, partial [Leptodesmis sp.]|uniref:PAS domain-containing protein n=1 Tax=Leptodesmis sp. TaxID=3100501 RepID=UPI0040535685
MLTVFLVLGSLLLGGGGFLLGAIGPWHRPRSIQQREERLRLALDAIGIGVWQVDLRTGEQIWLQQSEAIWGFAPGMFDSTMESCLSRIHPNDQDYVQQAYQDAWQTGQYQVEYRIVLPDQSIRWLSNRAQVFYDAAGQPTCMIGIALDVTDRKQAEINLQEQQAQLNLALEAANMGIWEGNLITGAEILSPGAEALLGFAPGTFDGKRETFLSRIHPDDVKQVQQASKVALQTGILRDEYRIVLPDQTIRWINCLGKVFYDEAGDPLRIVGVGLDITERKRTEAALQQQLQREQSLNRVFQAIRQSLTCKSFLPPPLSKPHSYCPVLPVLWCSIYLL